MSVYYSVNTNLQMRKKNRNIGPDSFIYRNFLAFFFLCKIQFDDDESQFNAVKCKYELCVLYTVHIEE